MWDPSQDLKVSIVLQNINEVIQKFGVNLKKTFAIIYANNNYKININLNKLIEDFKVYIIISYSSWKEDFIYFLNNIVLMIDSSNETKTGNANLERFVKNRDNGKVIKKLTYNAKTS
tara:strand:- start:52 stop:402 length:351 start_codon:yes stop_codon:yes gene_type:complete